MRNVVNCLKNRSSHLLWNQEVGDTCGSVKEEIGAGERKGDYLQGG
jgi:hypothetical protein